MVCLFVRKIARGVACLLRIKYVTNMFYKATCGSYDRDSSYGIFDKIRYIGRFRAKRTNNGCFLSAYTSFRLSIVYSSQNLEISEFSQYYFEVTSSFRVRACFRITKNTSLVMYIRSFVFTKAGFSLSPQDFRETEAQKSALFNFFPFQKVKRSFIEKCRF